MADFVQGSHGLSSTQPEKPGGALMSSIEAGGQGEVLLCSIQVLTPSLSPWYLSA